MKRFFALLLCLVLSISLLALASCDDEETPATTESSTEQSTDNSTDSTNDNQKPGVDDIGGKTPEELYNEALQKVASLTNYRLETAQVIVSQGLTVNQLVVALRDGQNEYVKTTNDTNKEAEIEAWYVDEVYYGVTSSSSFKASIPYETYVAEYMPEGSTGEGAFMSIPADWFKDIKFYKDGDAYFIEFLVSGAKYLEYINSKTMSDMIKGDEDISYKVYFTAEGELDSIVTSFTFEVDNTEIEVTSTTSITGVGETTIVAPENTEGFVDITEELSKN